MKWRMIVLVLATTFPVLGAGADTVTYRYAGDPMVSAPHALTGGNFATGTINGSMTLEALLETVLQSLYRNQVVRPFIVLIQCHRGGTYTSG